MNKPPQNNQEQNPIDRLTWQLDFAKSKSRDLIAITRGDLEYLMKVLHSNHDLSYKMETPQA